MMQGSTKTTSQQQQGLLKRMIIFPGVLLLQWMLMPQFYLAYTPPNLSERKPHGPLSESPLSPNEQLNYDNHLISSSISSPERIASRNGHSNKDNYDSAESTRQPTTTSELVEVEQRRACHHVNAILDLYNCSTPTTTNDINSNVETTSATLISHFIVSKAIEGLILRVCHHDRKLTIDDIILNEVESIFWRSCELQVVPSHRSLDALWHLFQDQFETKQFHPGKHVGRSAHLLRKWISISQPTNLPTTLSPAATQSGNDIPIPPYEYIHTVFSFADERNKTMTYNLWDLYKVIRFSGHVPRRFFDLVLSILSKSPKPWKLRQCLVLQDMERVHRSSLSNGDNNNNLFAPSIDDMDRALTVASRAGMAPEATWLFRMLTQQLSQQHQERRKLQPETYSAAKPIPKRYYFAWFTALCISPDQGSTFYLERLLEDAAAAASQQKGASKSYSRLLLRQQLHRANCYNLVLKRYARMKIPGAGMRAEKLFKRLTTHYKFEKENGNPCLHLRPDETSVRIVVQCYLEDGSTNDVTYQDAMDAYSFVKQSVPKLAVVVSDDSDGGGRSTRGGYKIFDRLLGCLSRCASDNPNATIACENLFRFFIIQYKENRVSEVPNASHLDYVVDAIRKRDVGGMSSKKDRNQIRSVLFQLLHNLKREAGETLASEPVFDANTSEGIVPSTNETAILDWPKMTSSNLDCAIAK